MVSGYRRRSPNLLMFAGSKSARRTFPSELADVCRIKISQEDIPELVAHAAADVCCSANPVHYSLDNFKEIFEKAW